MTEPKIFLLKEGHYLPAAMAESLLGSIVPDFESPRADFRPRKDSPPVDKGDVILTELSQFDIEVASSHSNTVNAKLDGIFGMKRKVERRAKTNLAGKTMRFIRLQQHGDILKSLMKADRNTKEKVLEWTRLWQSNKEPVCMIVGVLLSDGGSVKSIYKTIKEIEIKGGIPLIPIASAIAGVPVFLPFSDIAAGVGSQTQDSVQTSGQFRRSTVIGLQLRVIRKKLWEDDVKFSKKQPSGRPGQQLGDSEEQEDHRSQNPESNEEEEEEELDLGDDPFPEAETSEPADI